jgi:hypothetical protein
VTFNDGTRYRAQGSLPVALHDAGYTTILTGRWFHRMAQTMRQGPPGGWDSFDG